MRYIYRDGILFLIESEQRTANVTTWTKLTNIVLSEESNTGCNFRYIELKWPKRSMTTNGKAVVIFGGGETSERSNKAAAGKIFMIYFLIL